MIPNIRSLLIKIHDLLDGKLDVKNGQSVAKDYLFLCQHINSRIGQFNELIDQGHYYAALDVANIEPSLTTQIEKIRFPRETEWTQFLNENSLPVFEGFDDTQVKRLKDVCLDPSIKQPPAYKTYRKAVLTKDLQGAIDCLRQLKSDFPNDQTALHELARLEKESFEQIDKQLAKWLRQKKEDLIIEKVGATLAQDWEIELQSENWSQGLKIYTSHQEELLYQEVLTALSQGKVVRRVGSWEDAELVVSKLREAKSSPIIAKLNDSQRKDLEGVLTWYQTCENEANEAIRNQDEFERILKKLNPDSIQNTLALAKPNAIKRFRNQLQDEWAKFQKKSPSLSQQGERKYEQALDTIALILRDKSSGSRKWKRLSLALAPILIIASAGLFWVNTKESELESAAQLAHEASDLGATQHALIEWDAFTSNALIKYNPFRHYRARREIEDHRNWMLGIENRISKIHELLDQIEPVIQPKMSRSELRRVQTNLEIAKELGSKIPDSSREGLDQRIAKATESISGLRSEQITLLRAELQAEISKIQVQFDAYFPESKTDFSDLDAEIADTHDLLNRLGAKFRQSFETDDIADLLQQFEALEANLEAIETAAIDLKRYGERLQNSIALSEYLDYIEHLATLPFKKHPLVKQAIKLHPLASKFRNLAQQLLIPNNPVAWEQFIAQGESTMVAEGIDRKEKPVVKALLRNETLSNINRYRVQTYRQGAPYGIHKLIYVSGDAEISTDTTSTSGRVVTTVSEFDEPSVGIRTPFKEKAYVCELDGEGKPINGEILSFDRLSPESGFYRQIDILFGYDETNQQFEEPLLGVLDAVKSNEFISPIFKAWVTQEIVSIMIVRAFDWGINFCPPAQIDFKKLQATTKGRVYAYDWMRPSTQNRILDPLFQYYQNLTPVSYLDQAKASRELFNQIARQRVRFGGYASENGTFMLLNGTPSDRKLFGLRTDGTIEMLRRPADVEGPMQRFDAEPYSPIMFFNDPPNVILNRVTRITGVNVNSESFRPYLPGVFL